jgi:hypothetical protein
MSDDPFEAHNQLIFALGETLAAWQLVEREFLFSLQTIFQSSRHSQWIYILYEGAQDISKKVSMLRRLIEYIFQHDKLFLEHEWKPIYKDFRPQNSDRNHLVHWSVLGMPHGDQSPSAGQVDWFLTRSMFDPTNLTTDFPMFKDRLNVDEIQAMGQRFIAYSGRVSEFRRKLGILLPLQ